MQVSSVKAIAGMDDLEGEIGKRHPPALSMVIHFERIQRYGNRAGAAFCEWRQS